MFQVRNLLAGVVSAAVLTACGGGGGSSSTGISSSSSVQAASSSSSSVSSEDYTAVAGLYDVSSDTDEQYYYIDENGVFTAYNYLGDSADGGDNCYRESTGEEANAELNGQTLTVKSDGNFAIDAGGNEVTLEMDGNSVSRVSASGLSAGGTLAISLNGVAIRITTAQAEGITIEDIQSMMCQ